MFAHREQHQIYAAATGAGQPVILGHAQMPTIAQYNNWPLYTNYREISVSDEATWPPERVRLTDWHVGAVREIAAKERYSKWPADFDSKGWVRQTRRACGEPFLLLKVEGSVAVEHYAVMPIGPNRGDDTQLIGDEGAAAGCGTKIKRVHSEECEGEVLRYGVARATTAVNTAPAQASTDDTQRAPTGLTTSVEPVPPPSSPSASGTKRRRSHAVDEEPSAPPRPRKRKVARREAPGSGAEAVAETLAGVHTRTAGIYDAVLAAESMAGQGRGTLGDFESIVPELRSVLEQLAAVTQSLRERAAGGGPPANDTAQNDVALPSSSSLLATGQASIHEYPPLSPASLSPSPTQHQLVREPGPDTEGTTNDDENDQPAAAPAAASASNDPFDISKVDPAILE